MPTSTRSARVQPWSTAAWPIVTSLPMVVGWVRLITCTTVSFCRILTALSSHLLAKPAPRIPVYFFTVGY
jgi:hypothetical protein